MKRLFLSLMLGGLNIGSASDASEQLLPQLLSNSQGLNYVCEHAQRPYALILRKSHACDNSPGLKQCMMLTQGVMDECNTELHKTFSIFHIRKGRYENFDSGPFNIDQKELEAWKIWDEALESQGFPPHPGLIIVDAIRCKILNERFLYDVEMTGTRAQRAASINHAVMKEFSPLDVDGFQRCESHSPDMSLRRVWDLMNQQDHE
ncbi:MAG: hypothetical protein NTV34_06680 [Proteobacteria bacterium]|nr:hypothetical protein [Pseudomonadota bacterium]